ncbi:MAG: hypothetical protein ACREP2_01940 [Rhodanobacteraceae bacterium]
MFFFEQHVLARTVKKIPEQVLARCEWSHDDCSRQVENLPHASEPETGAGAQSALLGDELA